MTQQLLTGAPTPEKISGQEFQFFPLSEQNWEELDQWVRQRFLEINLKALSGVPGNTESFQKALFKAAAEVSWSSPEGRKFTASPEGLIRTGWLMIKKSHRISPENFGTLVREEAHFEDNLEKLDRLFLRINFPDLDLGDSNEANTDKTTEGKKGGNPTLQKKSTES